MDRFSFDMYKDCTKTIYAAIGFAPAAVKLEERKAAGKAASDGLKEFAEFFLKDADKKFLAGDKLSIADFKVAPFFAAYAHPRVKSKCFVDVPARILQFNADFAEACPSAEVFQKAPEGMSLTEMLDAKD